MVNDADKVNQRKEKNRFKASGFVGRQSTNERNSRTESILNYRRIYIKAKIAGVQKVS